MSLAPEEAPRPPSVLRAYVPIVLFMFLCGIVGPIFLIMGLAIDDEPGSGWLLPTGIGITILDLALGLLIGTTRYRSQMKVYRLKLKGRPAQAQVLSFEQTGVEVNGEPLLSLKLRIHGNDVAPFEVEAKKIIPAMRMPLLYVGEIPVLIDPETQDWEFDWSSAGPVTSLPASLPAAPATPAAPRDTRTAGERLAELDDLLRRDLVSRDEYDASRARIIAEL
ncbi:hypothetical protein ACOACQ_16650 [Nocardioides sp. CPCC 206347]|uniref:hypothetical protein n=1 Tax=Nocardioides sp. CPCC 206347 TaxID=3406463 RepID=UPI003B430157